MEAPHDGDFPLSSSSSSSSPSRCHRRARGPLGVAWPSSQGRCFPPANHRRGGTGQFCGPASTASVHYRCPCPPRHQVHWWSNVCMATCWQRDRPTLHSAGPPPCRRRIPPHSFGRGGGIGGSYRLGRVIFAVTCPKWPPRSTRTTWGCRIQGYLCDSRPAWRPVSILRTCVSLFSPPSFSSFPLRLYAPLAYMFPLLTFSTLSNG